MCSGYLPLLPLLVETTAQDFLLATIYTQKTDYHEAEYIYVTNTYCHLQVITMYTWVIGACSMMMSIAFSIITSRDGGDGTTVGSGLVIGSCVHIQH